MAVRHALEDVSEIGEWLDVVEPCGGDAGADGGPARATTIGAGEEMILSAKGDGPEAIGLNSLIAPKISLFCEKKFPVPLRREFGWKSLNSLAD
jgi:hypothetical protein